MDRFGWSHELGQSGTALGAGCIATGRTSAYSHSLTAFNTGPAGDMSLRWSGSNAPSGAVTALHLDLFDAALAFPGLCTALHSLGSIASVPLGAASSTGSIASTTLTFPYSQVLVGLPIVSQLLSVDSGQAGLPVALSRGQMLEFPDYLELSYTYGTPTAATGVRISPGTLPVAQFTY
jgi:hypothetical protein